MQIKVPRGLNWNINLNNLDISTFTEAVNIFEIYKISKVSDRINRSNLNS
jgi:hypothetical protein